MGTRPWIAVVVLLAASAPLMAHHSLADYDLNAPITLRGPIVRVEWVNPHTYIYLRVTTPKGESTIWQVEGGAPRTLNQENLTREMLVLDTVVEITGYNSKNGAPKALGAAIMFPDGAKFRIVSRPDPKPVPRPPLSEVLWSHLPEIVVAVPCLILAAGLGILWWRRSASGPSSAS